ncbi:MAG: zf-TFIIB domain-containing protein [Chloroflexota bacterium]|jgi:Zn-finger nucleic acid-binding protein
MICPIDQTTLDLRDDGSEAQCPDCKGVWLTTQAMEDLEDQAGADMIKGQRIYGAHEVEHACPHCGEMMTRFRYRGYNLEIETCPQDAGFWLDAKEDREVRDIMKKRRNNLGRAASAERSWHHARRGTAPSLVQRIRNLLGIN